VTAVEVPTHVDPLDRLGGPDLDLVVNAPASVSVTVGELLLQLRIVCSSLVKAERGHVVTSPAGWRTLRDVSPAQLVDACRRTERLCPGFRLPGSDAQPVHARIRDLLQRLEAE
jgi:hypothetical protein